MKKKLIGLCLCLLLLCLCAIAGAEIISGSGYMSNMAGSYGSKNITWTLDTVTGDMTFYGEGAWGTYDGAVSYRPWDCPSGSPYYGVGQYLDQIKRVVISEGITNVAGMAFSGASNLVSVTLPSTIQSIDDKAFQYCSSLVSVKIPDAVTRIGVNTFKGCSLLGSVNIPSGMISIGNGAFWDCALRSIETYGKLGENTFRNCMLLSAIINNCDDLGNGGAFYECKNLTTVKLNNCTMPSIPQYTFAYCPIVSIAIPDTVTAIGEYAFGSTNLASVTLPSQLTTLDNAAFRYSKLTSIVVPDSVINMGTKVFDSCSNLTSATLPSGITTVPEATFLSCKALTSVKIPAGCIIFGEDAFNGCTSLLSIDIPEGVLTIGDDCFYNCSSLLNAKLPASLMTLGNSVFKYCEKLTSIEIPANILTISPSCFYGCSALNSVTFPASLSTIGEYAFSDCGSLRKVDLPASLISLSKGVFCDSGLNTVGIPLSLTSIGESAFYNCPLKKVNYAGTPQDWANIMIESGNDALINAYNSPEKTDISAATIDAIKDQVYTGKKLKPKVTVKYNGTALVLNEDYSVSWSNNKNIGLATVTVTGKGDYTGKLKATFKIVPKAVSISSLKAGAKKLTVKWKKGSSIDGYEIQYSLKKNFASKKTKTVTKAGTTSQVIKNLKKGKIYYVRIRTYKIVKGVKYYSAWSAVKHAKVK